MCKFFVCPIHIFITHGKPIFLRVYMLFYVHSSLALLGSEAQQSLCEICPTSLATFLGFLRFFMDLLVQDSIWIYLFFMAIWTYLLSLFWDGGSLYYSLHCDSTTLLNQAPSLKGSAGTVCWLGVFSVRGSDNKQLQQHQGRIIFLLGQLGYCQYPLQICVLGIHFILWV